MYGGSGVAAVEDGFAEDGEVTVLGQVERVVEAFAVGLHLVPFPLGVAKIASGGSGDPNLSGFRFRIGRDVQELLAALR